MPAQIVVPAEAVTVGPAAVIPENQESSDVTVPEVSVCVATFVRPYFVQVAPI